jgi:ABC-2 type transport system ATP-binding protein
MHTITTRNLTRRFGKVIAVENLNLKVPDGSLYGLIGPNGAGKTTTLRMLAGLLEPSSGEIRINELPIRRYWKEIQWQIGFMPDFFGVYEDLLVWEYLDFFARCYRLSPERRYQVTDELLELVDLADKRNSYVQTLSRGMRQRLCLAHALVHDPQVLLLDEPASGLDPRARVEMRELLRELRNMGKTIVLSSHILTELAELCDSVGIIEQGHLIAGGPVDEIRKQVNQARRLRIRVLSDSNKAEAVLRCQPGVLQIYLTEIPVKTAKAEISSIDLEVEFTGDDTASADLLETLLEQKVRVASFSEMTTDLEEVFLRLTKGEVA